MVLVCGGTLVFILANFSRADIDACAGAVFQGQGPMPEIQKSRAMHLLDSANRAALAFGILGFFVGFIVMVANLSDPSVIGPSIGMSCLSVVYAVGLSEICIQTFRIQVRRREASAAEESRAGTATTVVLFLMLLFLPLLTVGILFYPGILSLFR